MRKPFQSKYLERNQECLILKRALSMSNTIALTGLEGAGKTTLIRETLKEHEASIKWYTLSNFLTLPALLGSPDLTAEESLQKTIGELSASNLQFIVWDNLHFLNFQGQQKLIYSIMNSHSDQTHIFISDEKLDVPSDLPQITLGGLTQNEIQPFLSLYNIEIAENDIGTILSQTGGLPLLLKQWVINPHTNSFEKSLHKSLSHEQLLLLKALSFSKISLTDQEALLFDMPNTKAHLLELEKKNFIETSTLGEITIPTFVKNTLLSKLKNEEKLSLARLIYKVLAQKENIDGIAKLIFALKANEFKKAQIHADNIELEDLEQLTSENIHLLIESLQSASQINFVKTDNSKLARLLIHSLILANKRAEAIDKALDILEKSNWGIEFTSEKQWLAYDLIYWLDRSKYSTDMQKHISLFINQSKPPISFLFQIELNFVLAQNTETTLNARSNLTRIISEIKKSSTTSSTINLAAANAHYQLGINYMLTNENSQAIQNFNEAKKLFREIKRTYFELFCEFNTCLILFQNDDDAELFQRLSELKRRAALNGYKYLLAGADLLSSILAFNNLESSKALGFIEDSVSKIDNGMPLNSKFDILSTKIKILKDLGLDESAQKVFEDLRRLSSGQQSTSLKRLALETQIDFIPITEAEEKWKTLDPNSEKTESLAIYLLQRGIKDKNLELRNSLRNQLALLEYDLISAIRDNNLPLLEDVLRQMENLLKRTSEDRIEHIALWCLSSSLNHEKRDSLLEKIELYIKKCPMNDSTRNFFTSWMKSLQKKSSIKDIPEYALVHTQELERWSLWLMPERKKKYSLYTNSTVSEVDEIFSHPPKDGICIIDNQKEVYIKGKRTLAFEKKPILIQILVLTISNYPDKLAKATLASALWGESYDPSIHDARIYTSIQRIRNILGESSIENWEGGYRWSQKYSFYLYRSNETPGLKQNKIANVFIESLRKRKQNYSDESLQWMSRSDLVEAGNTSDATAKRVLAILLKDNVIEKKGNGPSTAYRLVR